MGKTWEELEHVVFRSRHTQYRPPYLPTHFTFYKKRLFFLCVHKDDEFHTNENTLFYIYLDETLDEEFSSDLDFPTRNCKESAFLQSGCHEDTEELENTMNDNDFTTDEKLEGDKRLVFQWRRLLSDYFTAGNHTLQYSREDELLRERKRLSSHGITSYEFHRESGRILFQSKMCFYYVDTEEIINGSSMSVMPHLIHTSLMNSRIDPKLNLNNGQIISYISEGDIFVTNVDTGKEMRLTFIRSMGRDDSCSAGIPSYVTQEDFDRFSGYWWEPKVDSVCFDDSGIEMHRVLYELVDESDVEMLHIISPPDQSSRSHVDTYRYPRAGGNNAKSSIRLVEFGVCKETGELLENRIVEYELQFSIQKMFPWAEYLVRCGWMNDARSIWMQIIDRRQKRLGIVRVPISAFKLISSTCIGGVDSLSEVELIWEETNETWINLSDILYFLPTNDSEIVKFIWSSESTGYRHLYLITTQSRPRSSQNVITSAENAVWRCDALSVAQLTEGEWEVDGSQIWVDEKTKLVYFMGTRESPLEQHLYAVSYECATPVKILTVPGVYNTVSIDKEFKYAVVASSSLSTASQVVVCSLQVNKSDEPWQVSLSEYGWIEKPYKLASDIPFPELFKYQNKRGLDVFGLLFKPQNVDRTKQYPTILYVYGGPAVQLVVNSQKCLNCFSLQYLTSLGYVIVMVDSIGSSHRGLNFESQLKGKMGTVEIEEQVEALEYVASTTGIIDTKRVAIHGWSYGGYLSLMGLAQRPDIFKIAIAGAPVTCWELYDTGYTEKYMDLPTNNASGYKNGSVLNYVNKFPNEQNRLLLIHGLIDENVHFSHTNHIISALIKEGKPYQLLIYPSERHGIRHPSSAQHYDTSILWFLQEHL